MLNVVRQDSHIYNACDAEGHFRGTLIRNGKKVKNSCSLKYSVYSINPTTGIAYCQSWDILGKEYREEIPVNHLVPLNE